MSQKKPKKTMAPKNGKPEGAKPQATPQSDKMFIVFLAVFLAAMLLVVGGVAIYSALQNKTPAESSSSQAASSGDGVDTKKFHTDPAYPDFRYTLNGDDTVTLADYCGSVSPDADIVIPDTLGGYRVTAIAEYCFLSFIQEDMVSENPPRSLTIPKSVTEIGDEACGHLSSLSVIYEGSESEWNAITVDREKNPWFQNATPLFQNK